MKCKNKSQKFHSILKIRDSQIALDEIMSCDGSQQLFADEMMSCHLTNDVQFAQWNFFCGV